METPVDSQEHSPRERVAFSVVVPVYNSTESLVELCQRLTTVFEETLHETFEIILVDDASPNPDTWETMERIQRHDSHVRVFQLMRNYGQHNATMCGLTQAKGLYVLTMDDDLQHPPEEIPKLVEAFGDGVLWDAVLAVPASREDSFSFHRSAGSWLFNKLMTTTIHKPPGLRFSSFRIMTRALIEALIQFRGYTITINSLICMNTQRVRNATLRVEPRKYGESGYSFYNLAALALNHVFNFSAVPLKVMSVVGGMISLLAMIYALLVVYWRITGKIGAAGFATIAVLLSFYSGVILLAIGIMGQYIMRILRTTTMGTQFTVRRSSDNLDSQSEGIPKSR
jgi:glycosyltransferase involved in cell wall biosynthesis